MLPAHMRPIACHCISNPKFVASPQQLANFEFDTTGIIPVRFGHKFTFEAAAKNTENFWAATLGPQWLTEPFY